MPTTRYATRKNATVAQKPPMSSQRYWIRRHVLLGPLAAFSHPLGRLTTSWFLVSHRVRRSSAASSHSRDPARCSSVQCVYGAAP